MATIQKDYSFIQTVGKLDLLSQISPYEQIVHYVICQQLHQLPVTRITNIPTLVAIVMTKVSTTLVILLSVL